MAWTYSDWTSQSTDAAKLSRLQLFRTEVLNKITGANANGADMAVDYGELRQLSADLAAEEEKLQARVDAKAAATGGKSLIRFRK